MNANPSPEESRTAASGPAAATNPAAAPCASDSSRRGREAEPPGQKLHNRARTCTVELDEITIRSRISASLLLSVVPLEQQKQSHYLIKVRTKTGSLTSRNGEELPIIPCMVAEVDVPTGKKTVLEYILKPVIKTTREALRAR